MFANKKSIKYLLGLLSFLSFFCLSTSQAQSAEKKLQDDNRHIERLGDLNTDEWEMDLSLPATATANSSTNSMGALPDAEQNQQLQQLLSALATNPASNEVLAQLTALLSDVLSQTNSLLDSGSNVQAAQLLAVIHSIDPNLTGLEVANRRAQAYADFAGLLAMGDAALDLQHVLEPEHDNALDYYTSALNVDPTSRLAQLGLENVQKALIKRAMQATAELDFELAEEWLYEASLVPEDQLLVDEARERVTRLQQGHARDFAQQALSAMDSGDFALAELAIIDLVALGGEQARVESLREMLEEARLYGGLEPGQIISDVFLSSADKAPQIVVVAADSFLMGSLSDTQGSYANEKPQHRVTIRHGFGFGVKELTVAEFRMFIQRSGYRTVAEHAGVSTIYSELSGRLSKRKGVNWQHGYDGKRAKPEMPVIHVNWEDAQAYVRWLAVETGKSYRLPSEAEFEYVARAGGSGTYWWGEGSPSQAVENLTGERDSSRNERRWTTTFKKYGDSHWGPAPAGSLENSRLAHPMGVNDIAGNVSEWTQDCWHENYVRAPADGSAWINPGCQRRVVRGGYWASAPRQSRAAFRISAKPETFGPVVGIRIARDL